MNKFDKISKITILLKTVVKVEYYMVLAKLLGSFYEFKNTDYGNLQFRKIKQLPKRSSKIGDRFATYTDAES